MNSSGRCAVTATRPQVVAMNLRSGAKLGQPLPAPAEEIDYSTRLNRTLPTDIRVLGWVDVPNTFHARRAQAAGLRVLPRAPTPVSPSASNLRPSHQGIYTLCMRWDPH